MLKSLIDLVERRTASGDSPYATDIEGLTLLRSDHEKWPAPLIFKPALCVVVQGGKCTTFGGRRFDYPPGRALVVSVEMPAVSRVVEASSDTPYLGIVIELDLTTMSEVFESLDAPPSSADPGGPGVFVRNFDGPLADCVLRMVKLLDTPQAIRHIAPMIMREICYWLLVGPQGGEVLKMVLSTGHSRRVVDAINTLRHQYAQPVRIKQLAAIAQLSPSAFHRQFKAITSMTPLQFQKQLRLLEARHMLVASDVSAEAAAFEVGYESPSQFSREYARMFGAPPGRDIAALRQAAG